MAISGLPLAERVCQRVADVPGAAVGFGSTPGLIRLNFPVGGALLALTSALAAACFVKAFGISFLALAAQAPRPTRTRRRGDAGAAGVPGGAVPRVGALPGRRAPLPAPRAGVIAGLAAGGASGVGLGGMPRRSAPSITWCPRCSPWRSWAPSRRAACVARSARSAIRRVPTWGCGGELSARTEYTATAFSKPLMMIFRAVYRPTRQVESLAEVSPYFPAGGALSRRDRADLRAVCLRSVAARGAARRQRHEGAPGGQPPRLPRLRARARSCCCCLVGVARPDRFPMCSARSASPCCRRPACSRWPRC